MHSAGTQASFTQTHWTMVLKARGAASSEAGESLAKLCQSYWYPLYAFIRRQGRSPEDAQDLTQGFFAHLLRRDWLANVGPEKGKFRTFLLACLTNYLRNEHAKNSGPRRNPGQPILPIDWDGAEQHFHAEPADNDDPSKAFERNWAGALIEQVLNQLRNSCGAEGKAEHFDALHSHLVGDADRGDFAVAAARLNISEGAARVAATRLRAQFRELLRAEIAATVENPADVDAEIAELFSIFAK